MFNCRNLTTLTAILALPLAAAAQTIPLSNTSRPRLMAVPRGTMLVPLGYTDRAQSIIPRFANGKTPPAGRIIGYGPGSVLRGTAKTAELPIKAVVVTEDYDRPIAQWQSGGTDRLPAVLQPLMADLTIAGYDNLGSDYSRAGHYMNASNWAGKPDLYDLARIRGSGARIENVNFFYCPGTALVLSRGSGKNAGQARPFDKEKFIIKEVTVNRAYRGISIAVVDGIAENIEIFGCRDYGLKIESRAGACHFTGAVHAYGIGDGLGTSDGPGAAVWFAADSGGSWGGPWYPENARIGMLIESSRNRLDHVNTHTCWDGNIKLIGPRNTITSFDCSVMEGTSEKNGAEGVLIANQNQTLRDGDISLANGEVGIRITNGNAHTLDNLHILGAKHPGASGIGIKVEATLNRCTIHADIQWLEKGIGVDLLHNGKDMIGRQNTIWVTSTQANPVELHPNWTTTPDDSEANDVRVNGVRYYRRGD